MNYRLLVSEETRLDIFDAFLWYENQRDALGFEFEQSLQDGLHKIGSNPLAYQVRYDSVRVYYLDRFPYGVHFIIDKENVMVFGVFHTGMDPNKWKVRL